MMSTAAWAAARKLSGSMSLRPERCWESSMSRSTRSVGASAGVWVCSRIICHSSGGAGTGRSCGPWAPPEFTPGRLDAPPTDLPQYHRGHEVLRVHDRSGGGHDHRHVEPIADEPNAQVDQIG